MEVLLKIGIDASRVQRPTRSLGFVLLQVVALALRLLHGLLDTLGLLFVKEDVVLHLLEVDLVVKVYNVLGVASLLIDNTLCVDLSDVILVLEAVGVLVDNGIESYLLLI